MTDKVTTPVGRCSFVKLLEPGQNDNGDDVYEVTFIFDPEENFEPMKRIMMQAVEEKWGKNPPRSFKSPFRRGEWQTEDYPQGYDLDKYPDYEGKIIVACRSYKQQPGMVDAQLNPILDPKEIYSGMWGRATVTAYAYDNKGGKGVSFGLQNFQKVKDGEPLGAGRTKAENDFEAFAAPASGTHSDMLAGI